MQRDSPDELTVGRAQWLRERTDVAPPQARVNSPAPAVAAAPLAADRQTLRGLDMPAASFLNLAAFRIPAASWRPASAPDCEEPHMT